MHFTMAEGTQLAFLAKHPTTRKATAVLQQMSGDALVIGLLLVNGDLSGVVEIDEVIKEYRRIIKNSTGFHNHGKDKQK